MTDTRVARRAALTALAFSALFIPALLTACGGSPPPPLRFAPLSWDYLAPLKLNVAAIDIDDSWTPRAGAREKGFLAPTPPVSALRKMAEDRLIPGGTSGRAVFVIDDASIVQTHENYLGSFAVHLDVTTFGRHPQRLCRGAGHAHPHHQRRQPQRGAGRAVRHGQADDVGHEHRVRVPDSTARCATICRPPSRRRRRRVRWKSWNWRRRQPSRKPPHFPRTPRLRTSRLRSLPRHSLPRHLPPLPSPGRSPRRCLSPARRRSGTLLLSVADAPGDAYRSVWRPATLPGQEGTGQTPRQGRGTTGARSKEAARLWPEAL